MSLLLGSSMATYYQPAASYVAPPQQYYTTAKPYYAPPQQYYTTTAKPYYPTTTYAPYTTTKPYQETYTTQQSYYQPTTKGYAQPSYVQPQTYSSYTTKGYAQPSTYYQKPSSASYYSTTPSYYGAAPAAYDSGYGDDQNGWYNYAFKFNVNDYYGNEQSRSETREADLTRGQYSVNLPDGRKQVVSYEADQNGYRADVSYEPADSANSDPQNYYSTAAYSSGY